ncbi:uncharacterized protein LOC122702055 [Cervus elaphus]|uniref:uncharacterized protein LOC122702055 n=1 Tax=Cervus elaphus TaxID=9860 RepID=UPI001CC31EF8|nr:uncharacterized protein LOC122702055 [Cervus elaphus]
METHTAETERVLPSLLASLLASHFHPGGMFRSSLASRAPPEGFPCGRRAHTPELLVEPKWKPSSLDPAVLGAPSWHPGPCVPPALLHLKGCHEARVCRGVAGCLRIVSTAQGSEGSSAPNQQDLSQTGGRGGPPGRWLCDSLLMDLESKSLHSGRAWGWGHGAAAAETPSMPGVGVVQETLRAAARTPAAGVSGLGSLGWGLLWSMSTSHAPLTPAAPHPSQARSVSVWPWVPTLSPESRSSLSKAAAIHTDPENPRQDGLDPEARPQVSCGGRWASPHQPPTCCVPSVRAGGDPLSCKPRDSDATQPGRGGSADQHLIPRDLPPSDVGPRPRAIVCQRCGHPGKCASPGWALPEGRTRVCLGPGPVLVLLERDPVEPWSGLGRAG